MSNVWLILIPVIGIIILFTFVFLFGSIWMKRPH